MASAHDKLLLAQRIEEMAALIYERLALRFAADDRLGRTFKKLAQEEVQHALRVKMLRASYARNPRGFDAINLDVDEMDRLLVRSEAALAAIESQAEPLDASEATQMMITLEQGFAAAHAHAVAKTPRGEVESFFAELAKQDETHVALLRDLFP